jgi:hypothetical protein
LQHCWRGFSAHVQQLRSVLLPLLLRPLLLLLLLLLLGQVMAEGGLQGQAEFDTEQQLLARLSHGHLVRLLGVVRSAAPPLRCLLYELMPGGNVEEQLASEVRPAGGGGAAAGARVAGCTSLGWRALHFEDAWLCLLRQAR